VFSMDTSSSTNTKVHVHESTFMLSWRRKKGFHRGGFSLAFMWYSIYRKLGRST